MKLQDRVAIVTGARRGIGKAIALALAKEGAIVVLSRTLPEVREIASKIKSLEKEALAIKYQPKKMGENLTCQLTTS